MLGLYFLGTSSGVPTRERNVSGVAVLLPESKAWILVDCGEGTQHQILRSPLSLVSLQAICITHVHGDHCYGLPGLLASSGMAGRTRPLTIIAPREVEEMISSVAAATDLHLPYQLNFLDSSSITSHKVGSIAVSTVKLSHRVPCYAFCFDAVQTKRTILMEKLIKDGVSQGPLWGQLQQGQDISLEDGKTLLADDYTETEVTKNRIIVAGDNDDPELLSQAAESANALVHEATYTEPHLVKVGAGPQHSSALRVAKFAESVGLPNLVLTHFSARYQSIGASNKSSIDEIHDEAKSAFAGNLFLAGDHCSYKLSNTGELDVITPSSSVQKR